MSCLIRDRSKLNRNIERYLTDYIKFIIKSRKFDGQFKFRSLLMLKNLSTEKNGHLLAYAEKKILSRFFELSKSELKENVLLQIEPNCDKKWSADFYQLLLEMMDEWGVSFGTNNPSFKHRRTKLFEMKRLPIESKFKNFPKTDTGRDTLKKNGCPEFLKCLEDVKKTRDGLVSDLLGNDIYALKTERTEEIYGYYLNVYQRLNHHPIKQQIVNNERVDDISETDKNDMLNEILFFQTLQEMFGREESLEVNKNFFVDLQTLMKNFFNHDIDIEKCVKMRVAQDYVYELDKLPEENLGMNTPYEASFNNPVNESKNKIEVKEKQDMYHYADFKPDNDDNSMYFYNMQKENTEKENIKNEKTKEINEISKKNENLAKAIEELEKKKLDINKRIKKIEDFESIRKSMSRISSITPNKYKTYDNNRFYKIMETKDNQISNLQNKINKLENEVNKMDNPEPNFKELKQLQTNRQYKSRSKSNISMSMLKSKSTNVLNKKPRYMKSDKSGTAFVQQIYGNINKILGERKLKYNENSYKLAF